MGGSEAPLFPAPGLADLDRLVARTAGAGVQVKVARTGRYRDLPASIDLSAYRIVQEALTNVVKHARTGLCQVHIDYGMDSLTVQVTDNGAGSLHDDPTRSSAVFSPMPLAATAAASLAPAMAGSPSRSGAAGRPADGLGEMTGAHGASRGHSAYGGHGASAAVRGVRDRHVAVMTGSGAGHGIIGMRERVNLLGGEFSAGPLPGYGFQVTAHIPLPEAAG